MNLEDVEERFKKRPKEATVKESIDGNYRISVIQTRKRSWGSVAILLVVGE